MGKKRVKGEGAIHDEQKKQIGGVWLTQTALDNLNTTSEALKISRSELIELLARNGADWLIASVAHNVKQ